MQHESNDWKKYLIVFFITATLFGSAWWLSNFFNSKKIDQVRTIEDKISIDLMSSETQFSLLQELSCTDASTSILSDELNSLADKITYSEDNIGNTNTDVISLKRSYSLLEIQDYLLMKKITERCGQKSIFILYFYNNDDCTDCTKEGYVLTNLREAYPNLRVYSFDYNLDLSAIRAMISLYKVPNNLPALVINGQVYSGFQDIDQIEKTFPQLQTIKKKDTTTTPATTTKSTKGSINSTTPDTTTSANTTSTTSSTQ